MDVMSQSVHFSVAAGPGQSELVRSIRNFREELNWYYNLIEREQLRPEERSQDRIKHLQEQARMREADLTRALQEATIAEAHQAGVQVTSKISLEEIRAALPEDAALVDYFRVQDRSLACVLTRKQLHITPVTVHSRIQKLLQLLQFQISKFRLDPQYVATFSEPLLHATVAHLKSLYQELLAPIRPLLDVRHLVFVPHGLLHYVPFHALHDGESHLVDRYSISYAPSAGVYAVCQAKHVNDCVDSLILGVPDVQAPSIRSEVEALSRILPNPRLFVGNDASEEVLRTYGRNNRVVHIATHG
jgi:CHAT domain-containing protein